MPTLSSLLVHRSVASMQAVEDAIARQVVYGDDLATNVLEVGAAREDDVTRLAAESLGMFPMPSGKIVLLDPGVLRLIPGDVAQRYGIFPIEKRGSDLVVATSEPLSQNIEEDLGFLLNLNLRPVYALHVRIVQALGDHYGQPIERRYKRLLAKLEGRKAPETEPPGAGPVQPAAIPRAAIAPARTPALPPRMLEAPPRPLPGDAPATDGAAPMLTPDRPTLRGLAVPVEAAHDEPWGPGPENAAAGLPTTIELSPRPPAAQGSSFAEQTAALEAAAPPGNARISAAPITKPAEPTLREVQRSGAPGPSSLPTTVRAPHPPDVPADAFPQQIVPKIEGVPQALAAFARPSSGEGDARQVTAPPPKGPRARRKGPFPASLAEEEMQGAVTTDGVLEVLFDFAQQYFEYAALFVVHGDIAEGRDASGRGSDRARVATVGLPLDLPSTLASARERRAPVLSDFTAEGLDVELLQDLGRAPIVAGEAPSSTAPSRRAAAVVLPIVVRGRAVALLFGDDSPAAVELASIGEVIAFAALAGASIERIILRKKMGSTGAARLTPAAMAAVAPRAEIAVKITTPSPAPDAPPAAAPPPAPKAPSISATPRPAARAGLAALARMFAAPAAKAPAPAKEEAPARVAALEETTSRAQAAEPEAIGSPAEEPPAQEPSLARSSEPPPRGEEPFLLTPSAQGRGQEESIDPSESGSDALTVALTVPQETPPPLAAPSPSSGSENETQIVPDDALETVEPAAVEPSVPIELSGSEPPDVDSNAETAAPPVELRARGAVDAASDEDRHGDAGDRPSTIGDRPSTADGRPSAPIVVDVFADSTEGIASALARAAEEASARRERRQSSDAAKRRSDAPRDDASDRSAPPEETLTEGFPGAAPEPAHLTSDTPDPAPFIDDGSASAPDASAISEAAMSPPAEEIAPSPWINVTLEALVARAARGPDQAEARAELWRRAERNLAPLLALFPGPLDQDRHRSAERLPAASQCGPLLEALARAGARGAATVAVLARHDDVDVRFWAAHLLGEVASAEAADGLLSFLVDPDPAVRRVALRSATSVIAAQIPGRPLEAALGYVARDAQTPMRERIAAIDAMGQTRASFFVPMLIGLLGAVPDEVGEAARRSLLVLARQDFGRDAAKWNEWWSRNDARHRIEWLIDALMHDTQSIRRAAGDELKSLTKEYFGYYDDLPRRERERAQERYREWWERDGRARFK